MALGALWILLLVMAVISIVSIVLLFTVKDNKINNVIFGFAVIFGILVSYLAVTSLPDNYTGTRIIAASFGVLAIIGIILRFMQKTMISNVLVTASIVLSMLQLFFF